MIIFIILHLISNSLYATKSVTQKQENIHEHVHYHNNSIHLHKHSHVQTNIHLIDFFEHSHDGDRLIILKQKKRYLETQYFISNPTLRSIFRPPIV